MDFNDGGPAFPCENREPAAISTGMSLWDFYAAAALIGIIGGDESQQLESLDVAEESANFADAMIVERNKRRGEWSTSGVWVNPKLLELLLKGKIPHARVIERDGKKYLHCSG